MYAIRSTRIPGRPSTIVGAITLFLTLGWLPIAGYTQATGPTLRLFPTTVLEDIRETGAVAEALETGLQEVIARLDRQQQLYLDSKCEGAELDQGCEQLARQLGATYLELLNVMDQKLPDMERAVTSTRASLERRLRTELGEKLTPWTLQETLLGNRPDGSSGATPTLRGHSGLRLSQRFTEYYQLVSQGGRSSDSSLSVIAADIYLDMEEAETLIAQTREEIARATLLGQLNQSFGAITPEMQGVVGSVKSILFGEESEAIQVAGAPPGTFESEYTSPLEW
jgi:hypothetical protein